MNLSSEGRSSSSSSLGLSLHTKLGHGHTAVVATASRATSRPSTAAPPGPEQHLSLTSILSLAGLTVTTPR